MRLHHLTITAFGPFPGTETVDFDELHEAGLFLLTGPTGAGKTSILDAVCFALYGSVPGARGVKALKSQHAGVYDGPEVVLDFSVRERRFVVRRTPEWSRPKKRGEGIATEKASASLVETTSGEDHFLTSRAAEVGLMISELVGMQASQFVQVAMLPQGEFQTFLRASSQERHDVLQHLFRTDRFARIEGWVHDHSRRLRERAEGGQSSVQRILDTMADRAGVTLPDDLAGDALATGEPERPRSWATDLREAAREQRLLARRAHEGAAAAALTARAAHDDAVRRHALHRRRADAESALDALAEGDAAEAAARATLESGERASGCLPVLRLLDDARAQLDHATSARDDALDRLRAHRSPGPVLPDDLADLTGAVAEQAEQDLRAQITRVEALVPRERARAEAAGAMTRAHAEIEDAETELHRAEARRTAIPLERARLRKDHDRAARDAARAEALRLELDAARARSTAAAQVPAAEAELVRLQDRHRDARDAAADAREHVLTLATRRLDGMAAELATTLAEGAACQVCGSLEHPAPARPTDDAVTDVEQDLAARASDAAGTALDAATQRVSGAGRSLDALRQGADGLDAETASLRVSDLEAALAAAEDAADARDAIDHSLEELEAEEEQVRAGTQDLQRTVGSLRQTLAGHLATVESALRDIAVVLPDADATLEDRLAELRAGLDRVLGARRAVQTHEQARGRVHDLEQQVEATTTDRGFDSPDHARRAVLPDAERLGLEELLEERGAAAARTRAVLADPDVAGATAVPAELLAELDAAVRSTQQADEAAARSHHQQDQLVDSLESNLFRLDDATAAWAPLRDDHVRAESMSKLVRGMGHDNHLQMRLSAYVLATRLDQVVAAANERLGQMRDRRYLLQRTGRAARKGSQAGLGLEVVDQWTGEVREPTSLSGGETFVVSLSLALGLADVVTQESGGTEIETLFVDEGFGTLDADTLDDVMDRLDGLRVGGRAVGVVSHVSELRNRIPTQVHVEKTRTGSSIAVHTLVG